MKNLILLCCLLCANTMAKSQDKLTVHVIDRMTGKAVTGVKLSVSGHNYTGEYSYIDDIREPYKAICDPIELSHPHYIFDAKYLNYHGLKSRPDGIEATIYAYPKYSDIEVIKLPIAEKAETRNDSIALNFKKNSSISIGHISYSKKTPIWIPLTTAKKYDYDELRRLKIIDGECGPQDYWKRTRKLSEKEYLQENLFLKSNGSERDESAYIYRLFLSDLLKKNSYLDEEAEALKDKIFWQKIEFRKQLKAYRDTIQELRTRKRVSHPNYYEPEQEPNIPEVEVIDFPSSKVVPYMGFDTMVDELKALLEQHTVEYSGDLILKITINKEGIPKITVRHMPEGADLLVSEVDHFFYSISWIPAEFEGRKISDSFILAIKISQHL